MGKLENNIIFNRLPFSSPNSSYMHIKTEENIYTLFNDSYSSLLIKDNGGIKISHAEIYYLYKNGEFLKSFALKTFLKRLEDEKLKEIIEEDFILTSGIAANSDYGFWTKKGFNKFNSIFKNNHLFDKRIKNPDRCYREAIELLQTKDELN